MAQWRIDQHVKYEQNSKTIYELMMLADENGNIVNGANPTGMAVDAFGRMRSAQPFTLFDSFHRYQDNGKITEKAVGGSSAHNANAGLIECTIDGTSGSHIYRESSRVFAYQPGKSLQILQTYVMNPSKAGLRQRYGYFDTSNGIFLELTTQGLCWVERSTSTGSLVETRVYQNDWNYDKMDGTGVSKLTLDMTKAQIQFMDIEWLGLGSVRCGFVINGKFILTHTFHHANIITSTYMATACLPVRAEIENVSTTSSSSTLKIVCTSVISEGGYEIRGRSFSQGHAINAPRVLATPGTTYPVFSMRLKSNRLGAIVDPKTFGLAVGAASNFRYLIVGGAVSTGGTWTSAGTDSAVEYNLAPTSYTGGRVLDSGYIIASNQTAAAPQQERNPFSYQLERNTFTSTPYEFLIAMVSNGNNQDVWGTIQWQEIT
jgi:hypothetical protein